MRRMRVIGRTLLILALSSAFGLTSNSVRPSGRLRLDENAFVEPGQKVEHVDVQEAKRRLDGGALFLDARAREFYELGHIPDALSLPEEAFDQAFVLLEPQLRRRFDIVVYCSGYGCEASQNVAEELKTRKIEAAVIEEGWPAWISAGLPTRSGPKP